MLTHVFRTRLSKSLAVRKKCSSINELTIFSNYCFFQKTLGRHIKEIEDDERLSELFRILRERDISNNYADVPKDSITADSLDAVKIYLYYLCPTKSKNSLVLIIFNQ